MFSKKLSSTRLKIIPFIVILLLCAFGGVLSSIYATINESMNFQGKLVNDDGTNVPDGYYNFEISVYGVAEGGTALDSTTYEFDGTVTSVGSSQITYSDPGAEDGTLRNGMVLWNINEDEYVIIEAVYPVTNTLLLDRDVTGDWNNGDSITTRANVVDGIFNLQVLIDDSAVSEFDTDSLYLEVGYDGNDNDSFEAGEMFRPRKRLSSVPYAFRAKYADESLTSPYFERDTSGNPYLYFSNGGDDLRIGVGSNEQLQFGATAQINFEYNTGTNALDLTLNGNDLNIDGDTLFVDGSADMVGIGTDSPGTLLQLGEAGTTAGVLSLAGGTSGLVTIDTLGAAGTWTLTLPGDAGTSGYVLQTDGAGNTSWVDASSGGFGLWEDGTNGIYEDDEGVIVGGDVAPAISNSGFTWSTGDLYVTDQLGVEGSIYTDTSFVAGASLTLSDSGIVDSNSDLNIWSSTDDVVLQGGGGNVGVGTSGPLSQLSVGGVGVAGAGVYGTGSSYGLYGYSSGNSGVYGSGTAVGVRGVSTGGTGTLGIGGTYGVYGESSASIGVAGISSTGTAGWFDSASGYALIVDTGNVGLGTTTPAYQLQVNGTIAPETSYQDLGTSGLRWDLMGGAINADDNVFFSGLSVGAGSETTVLMLDGTNEVVTRTLGTNAFTSTDYEEEIHASEHAGNDLDAVGDVLNIEPTLNYVSTITRASSDLTLSTTTSGDININPASGSSLNITNLPNHTTEATALMIDGSTVGYRELGSLAFSSATYDNYQYWTLAGNSGTSQNVGSTQTASILGGTNGIDTTIGGTRTITINLDTTEVDTTTWGSGSAFTWTFDSGAGTDPTMAFNASNITLNSLLALSSNGLSLAGDTITDFTGTGLSVVGGALTNSDRGSSQNIFKNMFDGTNTAAADTNNDQFRFLGGGTTTVLVGNDHATYGDYVQISSADQYVGTVTNVGTGTGLTGGPITTTGTISFDYSATLAGNPTLSAGQSVFGTTGLIFEGGAADTFEGLLTVANPTGDRTWTLPNASGTIALTSDIPASDNYQYWTLEALDSGAVSLGTSAINSLGTAQFREGSNVTLGISGSQITITSTDQYAGTVTSVGTGTGLTGGPITTTGTISLDYTATLAGNPALGSGQAEFGTTGLIFEGGTADTYEGLLTLEDPTADQTWNLPDKSGTIALLDDIHYFPGVVPTSQLASIITGQQPRAVYVQDRYAYVVTFGSGLQIYDVSDPASLSLAGSVGTGSLPYEITVQGEYAYVVTYGSDRLEIYDISNANSPTSMGNIGIPFNPTSVHVQGQYAYISTSSGAVALYIVDISNPSSPFILSSISAGSRPEGVDVQGNYAYVTTGGSLYIFDITNPASPSSSGSVATGSGATDVHVQGRYAYVVNSGANTMTVVDVNNPASPSVVGSASTNSYPYAVYAQNQFVYVVNNQGSNRLQIFDVTNPASPSSVGLVATSSNTVDVMVQGRYAYVINEGGRTLQTFDLGGSYIQQLETGGFETGSLSAHLDAHFGRDLDVTGGVNVGSGGIYTSGDLSVTGAVKVGTPAGQNLILDREISYITAGRSDAYGTYDAIKFKTRYDGDDKFRFDLDNVNGGTGIAEVSWTTGTADLAENYYVADDANEGDLVSVQDIERPEGAYVEKTDKLNSDRLIGIISTKPGFLLSTPKDAVDTGEIIGEGRAPVALSGRVPTKVSTENGHIAAGDNITFSSLSGIGMRATNPGQIVGQALDGIDEWNETVCPEVSDMESIVWPEDDGENPENPCFRLPDGTYVGKIMVNVNISWYEPENFVAGLSQMLSDYQNGALGGSGGGSVDGWTFEGSSITSSSNLAVSSLTATTGTFSILETQVLNVGGENFMVDMSGNVDIAGDLVVAGMIEGRYGNIVLRLNDTEGDSRFSLLNSDDEEVFGVDSRGKVSIKEGDNASAGKAEIDIDETEIRIETDAVTEDSLVFVTPRSIDGSIPRIAVDEVGDGYFIVVIDKTYDEKVRFDWWIVN